MSPEQSSTSDAPEQDVKTKRTKRLAVFIMSDGSPSFSEWQNHNEPVEEFINRMSLEVSRGGGFVSCRGVELHEISSDPETTELIRLTAQNHRVLE